MFTLRRSDERGGVPHGWLNPRHSFSFADYHDPKHMGFRTLRVINEDRIAPASGFDTHPHKDMEIITYVISGALSHKDSMGNQSVILPGEVQRMSAGTGVLHSEYNHSQDDEVHLLQIWIRPNVTGVKPGYGQKSFAQILQEKKCALVVSSDGREGSISIHQDADVYALQLESGDAQHFEVREGRGIWVQIVAGQVLVDGHTMRAGDGAAIEGVSKLDLKAEAKTEALLFDLA